MSHKKQKERITIKVIPHCNGELISFQISKFFLKLIISLTVFILLISSLGFLFYYHKNVKSLESISNLHQMKKKNQMLKSKLQNLSHEADLLKTKFEKMQRTNKKIKELIDYNIDEERIHNQQKAFTTYQGNNEVELGSDYNFDLASHNKSLAKLVNSTEDKLIELKKVFPKKQVELKKLKKSIIKYKDYLLARPTGSPVKTKEKRITSYFGYRTHPLTSERNVHEGIDIGIWYGTKIYATGAGKIIYAGWKNGYGKTVVIDHGYGFQTLYAHNRRLVVKTGDEIERGDLLAYSGDSGRSTGPHLHYEIQINHRPVNPLRYIK